jgi:hypothetical protein
VVVAVAVAVVVVVTVDVTVEVVPQATSKPVKTIIDTRPSVARKTSLFFFIFFSLKLLCIPFEI